MPLFSTPSAGPADVGNDIIVIMGQSNAAEQGTFANGSLIDTTVNPYTHRIKQWGRRKALVSNGFDATFEGRVVEATFPLMHFAGYEEYNTNGNASGFGISLAHEYLRSAPPNRDVLIVACARGATTIAQWAPGSNSVVSAFSGLGLFDDAVQKVNAAIADNPNNRIVLVAWSQGENNAIAGQDGTGWAGALATIIATFRAQVTGAGKVPWVLAPLVTDFWNLTYPGGGSAVGNAPAPTGFSNVGTPTTIAGIQNAIDSVPGLVAFTGIIPTSLRSDLTGNAPGWTNSGGQIHFSAFSHRTLGQRFVRNALPAARANSAIAPARPVLTVGTPTGTTLPLTWGSISGATAYTVRYRAVGAANWTFVNLGNVTSYTITGLAGSTSYEIQLSAINATTGVATMSTLVTGSTSLSVPATPTGLALSSVSLTGFTASWGAVSGATSYTVNWRSPSGSGSYTTLTPNATVTNQAATGLSLSAGSSLGVTVIANNGAGSSAASAEVTASLAVPATPTGLALSAVTSTGATVSWGAVSGAASYTLQHREPGGSGAYTTITGLTGTSTNLTGLTISSSIGVTITAVNVFGSSTASSEVTASVTSYPSTTGTLIARHDFTLLTGSSGSAVASVPDQSGNNNTLTGTSITLANNVTGTAGNAKSGATLSAGKLQTTALSGGLTGASDMSGMLVWTTNATGVQVPLVIDNTATSGFAGDMLYFDTGGGALFDAYRINGGSTGVSASGSAIVNGKNNLVYRYTASSRLFEVWVNGTKVQATMNATVTGTSLNRMTIGESPFGTLRQTVGVALYQELKAGIYSDADVTAMQAYAASI